MIMLLYHRQFILSVFWSLLVVAVAVTLVDAAEGPQPGDVFDYKAYVFPKWWYAIQAQYAYKEVRKCAFLSVIPATYDSCPGVAKDMDHYYCIFGTEQKPTWYCTCMESVHGETDFKFYCGTEIVTFDSVEYPHSTEMVDEGGSMMIIVNISNDTKTDNSTAIGASIDGAGAGIDSGGDGGSTVGPQPGDPIDVGSNQLPTWWTTLRDQYAYKEVRQCPFLTTVPDTFDTCPGVSKERDHYYCIFGTSERATWYCTCIEKINGEPDYHFYCGPEIVPPDNIEYPLATTTATNDDTYSASTFSKDKPKNATIPSEVEQALSDSKSGNSSSRNKNMAGVFVSGFFTGIAVMCALLASAFYFLSRRKRRFQEKPLKPDPDDYYSSDGIVGSSNRDREWISTKELM